MPFFRLCHRQLPENRRTLHSVELSGPHSLLNSVNLLLVFVLISVIQSRLPFNEKRNILSNNGDAKLNPVLLAFLHANDAPVGGASKQEVVTD